MNEHTQELLKECNSGCKMAINSMNQVSEYVQDDDLKQVIEDYKKKHKQLEEKSTELLEECCRSEKDPGVVASAFSWISTEMKLTIQNDSNQIAKLMMNGCNMGIQSITKYQHEYSNASKEAVKLSESLVQMEEEFMKKIKQFL
jgi:hypothetical protein